MSSISSKSLVYGSLLVGACVVLCVAIVAQAQYNTFDSDSNSDSDGSPILTQSELGKLVRNSAKAQNQQRYNQQQQQLVAATRNLHNRQQPMQYAPTQHRRNYGTSDSSLNDFSPVMGASANNGRGSNVNNDDDEDGQAFGANFGANFDGGNDGEERSNADGEGAPLNLNQAASGYPGQGDYGEAANAGFGFGGGAAGYGSGSDGSDFGPSEGFGGDGRRAKSASSLSGSRGYGSDDDAGAPQYGPNSAINAGDNEDEGRAGYAPQADGENENDDE